MMEASLGDKLPHTLRLFIVHLSWVLSAESFLVTLFFFSFIPTRISVYVKTKGNSQRQLKASRTLLLKVWFKTSSISITSESAISAESWSLCSPYQVRTRTLTRSTVGRFVGTLEFKKHWSRTPHGSEKIIDFFFKE